MSVQKANVIVVWFTKCTSWIYDIPGDYYVMAIVAIIAYVIGYLWFPGTPGHTEKYFIGWFGWCDQGSYLNCAKAMAHWKLSPATYIYPLGYPLLAVPFVKRLSLHPFLIPNLFFSVGIVLAFYASCRKLVTRIESALLTILLIILSAFTTSKAISGGLIWFQSLIEPWNAIPVFFAAYLAIWLLVINKATFAKLWIVSLAGALAFFSRPPDILFLGIIYLAGLVDLKSFKEKIQGLLIFIFPCLFVLAAILITKLMIFHSLLSPYDINVRTVGFNLYDLPFKFYLAFFDGAPICGFKDWMLLAQMPWLLLVLPGITLLAKYTQTKFWYLMVSIAACLSVYISFNAEAPSSMINYQGFHYFIWVFPWLGLCAYLTLTRSWEGIGKWKTIAGILAGVLLVLTIGWKETVVARISSNEVIGRYDSNSRKFSGEFRLSAPVLANGIRIIFSKLPLSNMGVAGDWVKFHLTVDDREQILYHDYNLYQSDNAVYVSFRNSINQTGKIQKVLFQYDDTNLPVLDKILILKKEFKPFEFMKKMFKVWGIFHDPVRISEDQRYTLGSVIMMGAGGNSNPYKISGWSVEEQGYTWSEGHRALLGFKIPIDRAPLMMALDVAGLSSPRSQIVAVSVNGSLLKKIILSSNRQIYNIDIPLQYLKSDGNLLIQFDFPNAISPVEFGMNQDRRLLSMAVYGFKLTPGKFFKE